MNTPKALSVLYSLAGDANKAVSDTDKARIKSAILASGEILGLLQQSPEDWFKTGAEGDMDAEEIETLIAERAAAKTNKNYARSDEIRDMLKEKGVVLEDSASGTTWKRL